MINLEKTHFELSHMKLPFELQILIFHIPHTYGYTPTLHQDPWSTPLTPLQMDSVPKVLVLIRLHPHGVTKSLGSHVDLKKLAP